MLHKLDKKTTFTHTLTLSSEEMFFIQKVMFNLLTRPQLVVRQVTNNPLPFRHFHDELN